MNERLLYWYSYEICSTSNDFLKFSLCLLWLFMMYSALNCKKRFWSLCLLQQKGRPNYSALKNEKRDPSTPLRRTKRRALELLFLHKNETQHSANLGNFLNYTSLGLVPLALVLRILLSCSIMFLPSLNNNIKFTGIIPPQS